MTRWHSSYRRLAGWLVDSQRTPSTGPSRQPARTDGWVLCIPALGKTFQRVLGIGERRCSINRAEVGRDRPAFFPRDILQTVAYLMHNAELHLGLGKHCLDGLGEPFQAIDTRD